MRGGQGGAGVGEGGWSEACFVRGERAGPSSPISSRQQWAQSQPTSSESPQGRWDLYAPHVSVRHLAPQANASVISEPMGSTGGGGSGGGGEAGEAGDDAACSRERWSLQQPLQSQPAREETSHVRRPR